MIPGNAWLEAGEPPAETARWRSPAAGFQKSTARLAVSGDLVAADAAVASASLEVADVICSGRSEPVSWLTGTLERYPGCAVIAVPAAGSGYLLATRKCRPLTVACQLDDKPGLGVRDAPGSGALVCAMFVHAWLAAGWPLTALNPASLESVRSFEVATATPVPFALYYESSSAAAGPVSGPSSVSRRWTSSVSGAPILE